MEAGKDTYGMVQAALSFTEIVEPEFVDGRRADGGSVADVPLLHASLKESTEARNVRTSGLEVREGIGAMQVVEVVVSREMLCGAEIVIEAYGELVVSQDLIGAEGDDARARGGDIVLIQSIRRRVEACLRDLIVREDGSPRSTSRNRRAAFILNCQGAAGPGI